MPGGAVDVAGHRHPGAEHSLGVGAEIGEQRVDHGGHAVGDGRRHRAGERTVDRVQHVGAHRGDHAEDLVDPDRDPDGQGRFFLHADRLYGAAGCRRPAVVVSRR